MCTTCGCRTGDLRIEGDDSSAGAWVPLRPFSALHPAALGYAFRQRQAARLAPHGVTEPGAVTEPEAMTGTIPDTPPDAGHAREPAADLHYGLGPAHAHAPGLSQGRMVQIEQDILAKNDQYAAANRQQLAARRILALNLLSSPGSGKTTLLTETIVALRDRLRISVIEGDQQTSHDADRIRATGAAAIQINTGKGCHLDAAMIGTALQRLAPSDRSVLMIENVGNLVCPAGFDLGEAHKVVVLSVTEGEDKPLKYPDMFRVASLMLLNKIDLLPFLKFDVDLCIAHARRINPKLQVVQLSATTGQGMADWLAWIEAAFQALPEPEPQP